MAFYFYFYFDWRPKEFSLSVSFFCSSPVRLALIFSLMASVFVMSCLNSSKVRA